MEKTCVGWYSSMLPTASQGLSSRMSFSIEAVLPKVPAVSCSTIRGSLESVGPDVLVALRNSVFDRSLQPLGLRGL